MRRSWHVAGLIAVFLLIPLASSAQSAQTFSLQFSALGSAPFGGGLADLGGLGTPSLGAGWEAQLRINPSLWSFGFGAEQTFHDVKETPGRKLRLLGGFFEPRLVVDIGSDAAAPYLAARFALSQLTLTEGVSEATATGFTLNGGGGFLFRLGDRTNLDLGVTVGYKKLGEVTLGQSVIDLGTGANAVVRVGLAIGLGS